MDKKIGIIASDIELKNSIIELFEEEVNKGEIIIDILDPDNFRQQGKMLERKGAKAIIARSGGYRHTVGKVNVPVIHLKITTLDILHAIKTARKYMKDIILVISDLEYFDYDEWKDVIKENIIIERFNDKENIEDKVKKYALRKDSVLIVGGGIPCGHAKRFGMNSIPIGASKESIYEGVEYAKELIDNLYDQKYKNEILKTTLDGVHDAVVAMNQEGNIILFNERAEELLKKNSGHVLDKKLLDVCPELDFMIDVLRSKVNQYNEIKKLKKIIIAANISILNVDGHVHGVLCSFQDITKLQSLEKKIRYELNKKGLVAKYTFQDFISKDPIMKETIAKAIRIGLSDCTVMIYGESGTGKEMIAQSIHNISSRKDEPFVAINCAAISENLLESELFGYEEGAFTGARKGGKPGLFELAHKGTIFLDEMNSLSPNLQGKLLRVLEEREIMRIGSDYVIPLDVRIIAAANEELKRKVEEGSFRSDLFYRLNILEVNIPPLRERKKDIIPLFKHYVKSLSGGSDVPEINNEIEEKIMGYPWKGNVRELKNIAQRYVIFNEIDLEEREISGHVKRLDNDKVIDLKEINRFVEEKVIEMLSSQGMTKTEIAKKLGISRTALWKKTKS
ncbi:sigma 54-interacting transcriptional regulator [Clostridium sp. CF012]|uniref:sigma 54-interacting transcriptional regulator n=1 Tax=Clostridium sp. CF012 TaxID=2843319 RepID=UPI001C0DDFD3|nr:sigma 54-interacting transcriptional regulator [Clostridium sp. CF012]MBU3144423.1 sigma 54-interacting transcriptional regulator [Clostridium sp. CF012]